MRVAAIYDIHGNLPALEAVLQAIRREHVDLIVVGGDVVPGPMPRETMARLLDLEVPTRFIHGNGDRVVLAYAKGEPIDEVPARYRDSISWTANHLDRTSLRNGGVAVVVRVRNRRTRRRAVLSRDCQQRRRLLHEADA